MAINKQPKLSEYTERILVVGIGLVIIGIVVLLLVKGVVGIIILILGAVFGLGSQVANSSKL